MEDLVLCFLSGVTVRDWRVGLAGASQGLTWCQEHSDTFQMHE